MFRITDGSTFWLPVTIVANGDHGATAKTKVEFQVKRQDADTIKDWQQLLIRSELPTAQQCSAEITGWKGFGDESGKELECDDDNKLKALELWDVRYAFVREYVTAATKGRGKN